MSNEIKGMIDVAFHGESAYEIALRYGYKGTEEEWLKSLQSISDDDMKKVLDTVSAKTWDYTWRMDTDMVTDKDGKSYGTLAACMTADFAGTWFYAVTSTSDAGSAAYPSRYTIDGANGYLSLRDYVVWTGGRLVHIPTFEAKASSVKNADGKYSPKSGVDGLMSSTDKAYLGDLLNHWGKSYIPVYNTPTEVDAGWSSGYLVNWCKETGWYMGGFAKDCGGHPPVVSDNHTSWILLVLVGKVKDGAYPHALQVAFDLSNGLMYLRKGWLDANSAVTGWADTWTKLGGAGGLEEGSVTTEKLADGSVTGQKLSEDIVTLLERLLASYHSHDNLEALNLITSEQAAGLKNGLYNVILTNDERSVKLTENVYEVAVRTLQDTLITVPDNPWKYWRCIINASDRYGSEADIGISTDGAYADVGWAPAGKGTSVLVYTEAVERGNPKNPENWAMYEVDDLTRNIIAE